MTKYQSHLTQNDYKIIRQEECPGRVDYLRSDPDAQLRYEPLSPKKRIIGPRRPWHAQRLIIQSTEEANAQRAQLLNNPGLDQQMETMTKLMGKEAAEKYLSRVIENAKFKIT
jgi:hypothetical protein